MDGGGGATVTFRLFDWVDSDGVREPGQLYHERLDLLADAESQAFDIYHLAEHDGTPLGLVPSPNVFLAAAAVRTTQIRLCPLVYVLPLYQPARLAEEIAMLDQLSGGRLEIGFGKGGNPYELLPYGIDRGEAQRRYDQAFDSVLRILESGTIDAQGPTAGAADMPVWTRQAPYPPIWYPSSNPESVPGLTSTSMAWRTRRPGCRWAARGCGPRVSGSCATSTWGSPTATPPRSSLVRFGEQVAPALRGLGPG